MQGYVSLVASNLTGTFRQRPVAIPGGFSIPEIKGVEPARLHGRDHQQGFAKVIRKRIYRRLSTVVDIENDEMEGRREHSDKALMVSNLLT